MLPYGTSTVTSTPFPLLQPSTDTLNRTSVNDIFNDSSGEKQINQSLIHPFSTFAKKIAICQCFAGDVDAWNSSSNFMSTLFPLLERNQTSSQTTVVAISVCTSVPICIFAITVSLIKVRNQEIANTNHNGNDNDDNLLKVCIVKIFMYS